MGSNGQRFMMNNSTSLRTVEVQDIQSTERVIDENGNVIRKYFKLQCNLSRGKLDQDNNHCIRLTFGDDDKYLIEIKSFHSRACFLSLPWMDLSGESFNLLQEPLEDLDINDDDLTFNKVEITCSIYGQFEILLFNVDYQVAYFQGHSDASETYDSIHNFISVKAKDTETHEYMPLTDLCDFMVPH